MTDILLRGLTIGEIQKEDNTEIWVFRQPVSVRVNGEGVLTIQLATLWQDVLHNVRSVIVFKDSLVPLLTFEDRGTIYKVREMHVRRYDGKVIVSVFI